MFGNVARARATQDRDFALRAHGPLGCVAIPSFLDALARTSDDWRAEAACRDADTDLFFIEGTSSNRDSLGRAGVTEAFLLCGSCSAVRPGAQPFPCPGLMSPGSVGRGPAPVHQAGSHRDKDEDDAAEQQLVDNHEVLDGQRGEHVEPRVEDPNNGHAAP